MAECTDMPRPLPFENCTRTEGVDLAGKFVAGTTTVRRTPVTSIMSITTRFIAKPLTPTALITEGKTPIGTTAVEVEFENA